MNHSHFLVHVGVVHGVGVGFVIVVVMFGYGDSNMKNYSTCVTLFSIGFRLPLVFLVHDLCYLYQPAASAPMAWTVAGLDQQVNPSVVCHHLDHVPLMVDPRFRHSW